MQYYYAVKRGRRKGVFKNLDSCMAQVKGYPEAVFKRCSSLEEAQNFIYENSISVLKQTECTAYICGEFDPLTRMYAASVEFTHSKTNKIENILKVFNTPENKDKTLFTIRSSFAVSDVCENDFADLKDSCGEVMAAILAVNYALSNGYKSITLFHTLACVGAWPLNIWSADTPQSTAYKRYINSIKEQIDIQFFKISSETDRERVEKMRNEAKKALNCQ